MGGGLQFALSLGLIAGHDALGLSEPMAARLALASAGLWWGGFALFTFAWVDERPDETAGRPGGLGACVALGVRQVLATTRSVCADRPLLLFLLAFFFYNDGIQTVIMMATIYGKEELGSPPRCSCSPCS